LSLAIGGPARDALKRLFLRWSGFCYAETALYRPLHHQNKQLIQLIFAVRGFYAKAATQYGGAECTEPACNVYTNRGSSTAATIEQHRVIGKC